MLVASLPNGRTSILPAMLPIAVPMHYFMPVPFLSIVFLLCFGTTAAGSAGSAGSMSFGVFGAIRLPTDVDDGETICPLVAKPASCPVSCFKTGPVCGADGITYLAILQRLEIEETMPTNDGNGMEVNYTMNFGSGEKGKQLVVAGGGKSSL